MLTLGVRFIYISTSQKKSCDWMPINPTAVMMWSFLCPLSSALVIQFFTIWQGGDSTIFLLNSMQIVILQKLMTFFFLWSNLKEIKIKALPSLTTTYMWLIHPADRKSMPVSFHPKMYLMQRRALISLRISSNEAHGHTWVCLREGEEYFLS